MLFGPTNSRISEALASRECDHYRSFVEFGVAEGATARQDLSRQLRLTYGFHVRKLPIIRSPASWLFSGWNCIPMIVSFPTIAVMSPA